MEEKSSPPSHVIGTLMDQDAALTCSFQYKKEGHLDDVGLG